METLRKPLYQDWIHPLAIYKVIKGQVQETRHPITARQCQYYTTGRPLKGEGRKRCSSASGEDLCQPERRSWGMPAIRINGR